MTFLGTHSGKIEKFYQRTTTYSKKCNGRLLVFGSVSNFNIAVHVQTSEHTGNDDNVDNNDNDMLQMRINTIISDIAGIYPFRDIAEFLKTKFTSFDIIFYAYGQKTPASLLHAVIVETSLLCYVEIALGIEYYADDLFMTYKYNEIYKYFCYSNFMSNISCNLLVDEPIVASRMVPNCYRYVVYNTIQHQKTKVSYEINQSGSIGSSSDVSIISLLEGSIKGNISKFLKLFHNIGRPKLRIEGYFVITSYEVYDSICNDLRSSIDKLQLVSCPISSIQSFIKAVCFKYIGLLEKLKTSTDLFDTIYILDIYYLIVCSIFSLKRMNSPLFFDTNFGIAISEGDYDPVSRQFTNALFEKLSPSKLGGILYEIFKSDNDMEDIKMYILTQYVYTLYQKSFVYSGYIEQVVRSIKTMLNIRLSKNQARLGSTNVIYVSVLDFLEKLSLKFKNRRVLKYLFEAINTFASVFTAFYCHFLSELKEFENLIFMDNVLYAVQKHYIQSISSSINFDMLNTFIYKYSYCQCSNVVLTMDKGNMSSEDICIANVFDSFRNWVIYAYYNICKKYKLRPQSSPIDPDLLLRLLYFRIPIYNGKHCNEFCSVIDYFSYFNVYEIFISILLIQYYLNCEVAKKLIKRKDNFGRTKYYKEQYKKYSFSTILFLTGLFEEKKPYISKLALPLKVKYMQLQPLSVNNRYRLLGISNVLMVTNAPSIPNDSSSLVIYEPQVLASRYVFDEQQCDMDSLINYSFINDEVIESTNNFDISYLPSCHITEINDEDSIQTFDNILKSDVVLSKYLSSIYTLDLKIADIKSKSEEQLLCPLQMLLDFDEFSAKLIARKLKHYIK